MTQEKSIINCPNCGKEIDVNDILYHQVDEQLKKQYTEELAIEKKKYDAELTKVAEERQRLEADKQHQQDNINKQVAAKLKQSESILKKAIKAKAEEEQADALISLREELEEKSTKIKQLNTATVELEKLKRTTKELEITLKAEAEKQLTKKLSEEREKIQKEVSSNSELKVKELEKQLEDQKKLTAEMKRKQEQGSMQTQGEVQELAIEDWLREQFPLDEIIEIKKGERGADCLQLVNTRTHHNLGTIYYESKRTKAFQSGWIDKFKADIREKNAQIGVLVTEVMPSDMERLGQRQGIWICSYDEFKGLCLVLRESLVQLSRAVITQDNKGDKMGMLYDFLTSNEFKLQIGSIVDGFTQMKSDLESEQRAIRSAWKKREKQIEKVLLNTTEMYGSIRGIAGNAIQLIPQLELPQEIEDESDVQDS